jgi:hypothetical protein
MGKKSVISMEFEQTTTLQILDGALAAPITLTKLDTALTYAGHAIHSADWTKK